MFREAAKLLFVALTVPVAISSVWADDVANPTDSVPDSIPIVKPEKSDEVGPKYTTVGELRGHILEMQASGKSGMKLVLVVPQVVADRQANGNRNNRNNGNRNRNVRNNRNRNVRNNRAMPNRNARAAMPPRLKTDFKTYTLNLVDDVRVRRMKLLPKGNDDNGKPMQYTQEEVNKLREPKGVSGYAAEVGDLLPGMDVKLQLVRLKGVPAGASKNSLDGLMVRTVYLMKNQPDTLPSEALKKANAKKSAPKKK